MHLEVSLMKNGKDNKSVRAILTVYGRLQIFSAEKNECAVPNFTRKLREAILSLHVYRPSIQPHLIASFICWSGFIYGSGFAINEPSNRIMAITDQYVRTV